MCIEIYLFFFKIQSRVVTGVSILMLAYYVVLLFMLCLVRSVDLDGGNRQVVLPYPFAHRPRGLAIFEEYVYWVSLIEGYNIERVNRFTGLNRQKLYTSTKGMMTIRVNHPSKQPTG